MPHVFGFPGKPSLPPGRRKRAFAGGRGTGQGEAGGGRLMELAAPARSVPRLRHHPGHVAGGCLNGILQALSNCRAAFCEVGLRGSVKHEGLSSPSRSPRVRAIAKKRRIPGQKGGAPSRTRTCDRRIRNPMLYPTELLVRRKRPDNPIRGRVRQSVPSVSQTLASRTSRTRQSLPKRLGFPAHRNPCFAASASGNTALPTAPRGPPNHLGA